MPKEYPISNWLEMGNSDKVPKKLYVSTNRLEKKSVEISLDAYARISLLIGWVFSGKLRTTLFCW